MWKKWACGVMVAVVVGLCSLPAPALAGGRKHHRHYRSGHVEHRHYHSRHYHAPPVRYYAPPVRYYAPPVPYYAYPPAPPGVNVQIAIPVLFFSIYLW